MPRVAAQAVPSVVQATAGSELKADPGANGSSVELQVAPPSADQNCLCLPEPEMLFAPATRNWGFE